MSLAELTIAFGRFYLDRVLDVVEFSIDLAEGALNVAERTGQRAAYAAGRAVGAAERVRDAGRVALIPRDFPLVPWRKSLRWGWAVLRGASPRPLLRFVKLSRSIRKEVDPDARAAERGAN